MKKVATWIGYAGVGKVIKMSCNYKLRKTLLKDITESYITSIIAIKTHKKDNNDNECTAH